MDILQKNGPKSPFLPEIGGQTFFTFFSVICTNNVHNLTRISHKNLAPGPDSDPAQWQEWGKWSKCYNCKPGKPRSGVTVRGRSCGCTDQVLSCLSYDGLFRKVSIINNKTIGDEGITVDFRFIKVHTSN